jgi:hypothetical protein
MAPEVFGRKVSALGAQEAAIAKSWWLCHMPDVKAKSWLSFRHAYPCGVSDVRLDEQQPKTCDEEEKKNEEEEQDRLRR